MLAEIAGPLVSAGASLLGGIQGKKSSEQAQRDQMWWSALQMQQQKDFAQQGIRWKVEDAKAAGIHPLFALGASTSSYSPVSFGSTADTSMPNALASMGQDVGRAITATRGFDERQKAFTEAMQALQLQRGGLENDLLRSQISRLNQQSNPATPSLDASVRYGLASSGQGDARGLMTEKPMERVRSEPGAPWQEPGAITDVGYARTPTGLAPVPSSDVKQRIEDQFVQEMTWAFRNNMLPSLGFGTPPKAPTKAGHEWMFNPWRQEWQEVDTRKVPRAMRGFY